MEYSKRNLTSSPGLTQEEALVSLQTDPEFKQGSIITKIRRQANTKCWIADVLEPKTAEFPPSVDDGGEEESAPSEEAPKKEKPKGDSEGGDDSGESDGGPLGLDGPPGLGGDDAPGDKPDEGSVQDKTLHVLEQILHALQGGGAPEGMGGPDALGPGPGGIDGPPPPKGGGGPPGGLGGPPGAGGPPMGKGGPKGPPRPMKPGDTPPGGTPLGAPAFASLKAQVASFSDKAPTIILSTAGTEVKKAVQEARPAVEAYGYQVKQAKRDGDTIRILATRR